MTGAVAIRRRMQPLPNLSWQGQERGVLITLLPASSFMGSLLEAEGKDLGLVLPLQTGQASGAQSRGRNRRECICGQRGTNERTRHCCYLIRVEAGWDKGRGVGWTEVGSGNSLAVQQFRLRTFPDKGAGFDPWLGN